MFFALHVIPNTKVTSVIVSGETKRRDNSNEWRNKKSNSNNIRTV